MWPRPVLIRDHFADARAGRPVIRQDYRALCERAERISAATDRRPRGGQLQFACQGARRVAKECGMDERQTGVPDGRDVARLRGALEGRVLLPGEDAYDQARRVWNA